MRKSYKVIKPYRHHGELKKPGCEPLRMTEAEAQYGKAAGQLVEDTTATSVEAKPIKAKPLPPAKAAAEKPADPAKAS